MISVAGQYAELRVSIAHKHGEDVASELDAVFDIVEHIHRGQVRKSGDPYIIHPIAVAQLVDSWGMTATVVKAALAHDIPDSADLRAYAEALGPTVTAYIRAANALDRYEITAMALDQDAALAGLFNRNAATIKVADRLHNARTWRFVPQDKARLKARQTLAVIAPVAEHLGINGVAEELRTLSTAILAQPIHLQPVQPVRGAAAALLAGALRMLPPEQYDRYRDEWLADLAHLTSRRERAALAAGLIYSAWAIRRSR